MFNFIKEDPSFKVWTRNHSANFLLLIVLLLGILYSVIHFLAINSSNIHPTKDELLRLEFTTLQAEFDEIKSRIDFIKNKLGCGGEDISTCLVDKKEVKD